MGLISWLRELRRVRLTRSEFADQLERLAAAQDWDEDLLWDELSCVPIGDPELDSIREEWISRGERHIRENRNGRYFDRSDVRELYEVVRELRER